MAALLDDEDEDEDDVGTVLAEDELASLVGGTCQRSKLASISALAASTSSCSCCRDSPVPSSLSLLLSLSVATPATALVEVLLAEDDEAVAEGAWWWSAKGVGDRPNMVGMSEILVSRLLRASADLVGRLSAEVMMPSRLRAEEKSLSRDSVILPLASNSNVRMQKRRTALRKCSSEMAFEGDLYTNGGEGGSAVRERHAHRHAHIHARTYQPPSPSAARCRIVARGS